MKFELQIDAGKYFILQHLQPEKALTRLADRNDSDNIDTGLLKGKAQQFGHLSCSNEDHPPSACLKYFQIKVNLTKLRMRVPQIAQRQSRFFGKTLGGAKIKGSPVRNGSNLKKSFPNDAHNE